MGINKSISKQEYVSRRFTVTESDGVNRDYIDSDFFALEGPLVILGEPGIGKSKVVNRNWFGEERIFYKASTVMSMSSFQIPNSSVKVIIDGLDEVAAYTSKSPFIEILSKIRSENISNFIFTCRVIDWQDNLNSTVFSERWRQQFVIGKLLPLNYTEIGELLSQLGEMNIESFLNEAEKQGAVEFIRNPQSLIMLYDVVKKVGWPKTKTELFKETCKILAKEENSLHRSIFRNRPSLKKVIETSGFICSQLILANKAVISLEGDVDEFAIDLNEFSSELYGEELLKTALSTRLFRAANSKAVEPSHRTIAEFLAANWISDSFANGLSFRRIESILYSDNFIVPSALRGLHGWLSTIDNSYIQDELLKRDPYAAFRYGDPSNLSVDQSKSLLNGLAKISNDDPYFRSEDWYSSFGKGLAKPKLKDEFVTILKAPNTSYQLRHLLLESITGEDFSNLIVKELYELVINDSVTSLERIKAFEALSECKERPSFNELVAKLNSQNNLESLRISLKAIEASLSNFSAKEIAGTLKLISQNTSRMTISGLGHGLSHKLNDDQLHETLIILNDHESLRSEIYSESSFNYLMSELFQELLCRDLPLDPAVIWQVLNKLKYHNYYFKDNFREATKEYFNKNSDVRRAVQKISINEKLDSRLLLKLYRLEEASPGLRIKEQDAIEELNDIYSKQPENWLVSWEDWAWYIKKSGNVFSPLAFMQVTAQASENEKLAEILKKINSEVDDLILLEQQREHKKWERSQERSDKKRHNEYKAVNDSLENGKHLPAIYNIAKSYLGRFRDNKGDTAEEKVKWLVGPEMHEVALKSISVAISCNSIPSVREISDARAKDKEFYISPIVTAYLLLPNINPEEVPNEILRCAYASNWGVIYDEENSTINLNKKLESILFKSNDDKKSIVRDLFEPYFERKIDYVPALQQFEKTVGQEIAFDLVLEWLKKYPNLSIKSIELFFEIVLKNNGDSQLISIAKSKLKTNRFLTEELRLIWNATLILDIRTNQSVLELFVLEGKMVFWSLKKIISLKGGVRFLNLDQKYFLLSSFTSLIKLNEDSELVGDEHPWEASKFMSDMISTLSTDVSEEVSVIFQKLLTKIDLGDRLGEIKHAYSNHLRQKANMIKRSISLKEVNEILNASPPSTHFDLQSVLLDVLHELQVRLRYSPTNDYITFWDGDCPHDENYCRDRIVGFINPFLDRFKVSAHIEGRMPNNQRCDFLNSIDLIDVPVEVKGQWHKDLWTSGKNQLEKYSKEYRADGYGIFLILWFGISSCRNRNPLKYKGHEINTIDMMNDSLIDNYKEVLSPKTKIFILDLSKP